MRSISLFLSVVVFLTGCSIFGGKSTVSNWEGLDRATALKCETFVHPKAVLRTKELHVLEGKSTGFVADVVLRTGQSAMYYAPFAGSKDGIVQRDFGSGSIILGGAGIKKGVYVALLQRNKGKSKLELRTLPDNIVRFSSEEMDLQATSGKAVFTKFGVWMTYRVDANNVGEEDAPVGVVFFKFGKNAKLVARHFSQKTFPPGTRLLADSSSRKALVVWGVSGKQDQDFKFFMSELNPDKLKIEDEKSVDLPVSSGVESWAVAPMEGGMLIAYVDGDSLVGQSKLRISSVYWRGEYTKVGWKREDSLTNIHVSEPVWLSIGRRAKLMIPKWVDGESTIGLYSVSSDGTISSNAAGIFPKGTRVMAGFRDVADNDNYAITRYRNKGAWQFEICNLEDL